MVDDGSTSQKNTPLIMYDMIPLNKPLQEKDHFLTGTIIFNVFNITVENSDIFYNFFGPLKIHKLLIIIFDN
jgi:hypothetical protein